MRVRHLNCGTMRPFGGRLVGDTGRPWQRARLVCHCLLIESDDGLVLVETGFGSAAIAHSREWLGKRFIRQNQPLLDPGETAARQLARLGYASTDVRHIVLTHLDIDHAGGLVDFPHARVHVSETELRAARNPVTTSERGRYRAGLPWAHGPRWVEHASGGERWFGFDSVRDIPGIAAELRMVPLPGHTRGHTGIAVRDGQRWLLHAGDAYFHHGQIHSDRPHCPPALDLLQHRLQEDRASRLSNVERLRELAGTDQVTVFCAHDSMEFDQTVALATTP